MAFFSAGLTAEIIRGHLKAGGWGAKLEKIGVRWSNIRPDWPRHVKSDATLLHMTKGGLCRCRI